MAVKAVAHAFRDVAYGVAVPVAPVLQMGATECVQHGAKVILCGEHGVVYGARALGMSVPQLSMKVRVAVRSGSGGGHRVWLNGGDRSGELSDLISQAVVLLGIVERCSLVVEVESKIPLGAGLGSSAALCVGLVQALAALSGRGFLWRQRVIQMANRLERVFHGNPSGLDVTIMVSQGLVNFCKDSTRHMPEVSAPRAYHLLLVDSGVRASTKMMVKRCADRFTGPQGQGWVRAFDHCYDEFVACCQIVDHDRLRRSFESASTLLRRLGVAAGLEPMIEELMALGVAAVKPTGSGGGGYVLALLPQDAEKRTRVKQDVYQRYGRAREACMECVL